MDLLLELEGCGIFEGCGFDDVVEFFSRISRAAEEVRRTTIKRDPQLDKVKDRNGTFLIVGRRKEIVAKEVDKVDGRFKGKLDLAFHQPQFFVG